MDGEMAGNLARVGRQGRAGQGRAGHPSTTSHGLGVSRVGVALPRAACKVEGMHAPFCWCRAVPCHASRSAGLPLAVAI
jgi:hypothetical protein